MVYAIRFPDGTIVQNIADEETPEAAKARILTAMPELDRQISPNKTGLMQSPPTLEYSTILSASASKLPLSAGAERDKAIDGLFATGLFLVIAIGGVLLIKDHFRNNSKASPHELGVWLASFGTCIGFAFGLLNLLNGKIDLLFYPLAWQGWMLNDLLGSALFYGVVGYGTGQGYRRIRQKGPFVIHPSVISAPTMSVAQTAAGPTASANEAQPSEAHWAQALAEFDGPARRHGLWAKCFAEAGGVEAVAKAAYLNERAKQILAESSNRY